VCEHCSILYLFSQLPEKLWESSTYLLTLLCGVCLEYGDCTSARGGVCSCVVCSIIRYYHHAAGGVSKEVARQGAKNGAENTCSFAREPSKDSQSSAVPNVGCVVSM
jgi:hypothetical protein